MMSRQFEACQKHGDQGALVGTHWKDRLKFDPILLKNLGMNRLHVGMNGSIVIDNGRSLDDSILAQDPTEGAMRSQISRSAIGCSVGSTRRVGKSSDSLG